MRYLRNLHRYCSRWPGNWDNRSLWVRSSGFFALHENICGFTTWEESREILISPLRSRKRRFDRCVASRSVSTVSRFRTLAGKIFSFTSRHLFIPKAREYQLRRSCSHKHVLHRLYMSHSSFLPLYSFWTILDFS